MDATDDTPENSVWRRPCPCSLTAHDECLLEWITSQEAPKPGEMATTQKLVCPVCQAPIKVERPWDPLVAAADFVQRCTKTLMWPAGLSALAGCFYSGFLVYGVNALYLVFGQAEARRLLMPSPQDLNARAMIQDSAFLRAIIKFMKISDPFLPTMPGVKLFLGLPMILPALVLSRTRLADQIFAILPISVSRSSSLFLMLGVLINLVLRLQPHPHTQLERMATFTSTDARRPTLHPNHL